MRKGIVKWVFAVGVVTGSLVGGFTQTGAEAAPVCSDYCLDAACTCVIHCGRGPGGCICEDHCSID